MVTKFTPYKGIKSINYNMCELPGEQNLVIDDDMDDNDVKKLKAYNRKSISGRSSDSQCLGSPLNRKKSTAALKGGDGDGTGGRTPTSRKICPSDMDLMKERFAKLLLGEDMSGAGKGVSSALALSNAITNLAASVFGEQKKLEPMSADRKARWKNEIDWLLSVTEHIVEFVPSHQSNNGVNMEVMVTRQRRDLLDNIPALRKLDAILVDYLDHCANQTEFWYVSKSDNESEQGTPTRNDDKWWIPTAKVSPDGLTEATRRWLQAQKDSVNQVLKAAMAINAQVLSEIDIPDNYIESLPRNGRASLGDLIYKSITDEYFDPYKLLSNMDMSTEYKVLDLKNKIEASVVIWKRKLNHKDCKPAWGSTVSLEKREIFEERAETILLLLKQQFPGISQSSLDISKIQYNKDVGYAILESYSRVIESLAFTILSRIEDVMYADSLVQNSRPESNEKEKNSLSNAGTPTSMTLLDFMGWQLDQGDDTMTNTENDKSMLIKPLCSTPKKFLEKLENLNVLRSQVEQ